MHECPWCGWPCRGLTCQYDRGLDRLLQEVYDPPVPSDEAERELEAAQASRERER